VPSYLINEDTWSLAHRERHERLDPTAEGLPIGCFPTRHRYGERTGVVPADDYLEPIPRSKWKDYINEGEGTFLADLKRGILPVHNQGSTNYCWAQGSLRSAEINSLFETGSPILRSAESVAVPITGGRNRGGRPDEALDRLISHGACRQDLWPLNSRDTSNWTDAVAEDALDCRIVRWLMIESWEMQVTACFHRLAIATGLAWWGHLVCFHTPIILPDSSVGLRGDNSWGADWGDRGEFDATERRGTADLGCFAALTTTWPQHRDLLGHG
jgi:hypothetical protein